ncbi:GAF domain-containing protein [Streptosporangium sp. CA-135522]|uniref:GAF domain-containing protein n=1 Tax=Streptosporangium sp. CA-135522 TaxID=3240072 RepID=UPI003D8AACFC
MPEGPPRAVPDLDSYSVRLRRLHESGPAGVRPAGEAPRSLISASWRRSLEAGIDPEAPSAPLAVEQQDIREVRSAHPMSALLPLITGTLLETAEASAHVLIVADADGRVLWRGGDRRVMGRADEVGLADGFHWGEDAIGTNGMGTALAIRRPVHIFSAEHLVRVLHVWSCSAAPIVDPDSGEVLGCIDISGTTRALHPATVALVGTTARLVESHLALRMRERDDLFRARQDSHLRTLRGEPGALVTATGRVVAGDRAQGWGYRVRLPESGERVLLPDGRAAFLDPLGEGFLLRLGDRPRVPVLSLSFLGTEHPSARLDGVRVPLSPRHADILALLALNPHGMTTDQLSFHLYGDEGNSVTVRAEIHRLRARLGPTVAAKPYRLTCVVEADFLDLKRLLATEDAGAIVRAYGGPLLPRSEAPAVRREREELEGQVRARLLLRGAPEDLWAYAGAEHTRNDIQILERLVATLPADDHRAVAARIRLDDLGMSRPVTGDRVRPRHVPTGDR